MLCDWLLTQGALTVTDCSDKLCDLGKLITADENFSDPITYVVCNKVDLLKYL